MASWRSSVRSDSRSSRNSVWPRIAPSKLLKSWATPPVSWPTASIRWACRSSISVSLRCVTSCTTVSTRSALVRMGVALGDSAEGGDPGPHTVLLPHPIIARGHVAAGRSAARPRLVARAAASSGWISVSTAVSSGPSKSSRTSAGSVSPVERRRPRVEADRSGCRTSCSYMPRPAASTARRIRVLAVAQGRLDLLLVGNVLGGAQDQRLAARREAPAARRWSGQTTPRRAW